MLISPPFLTNRGTDQSDEDWINQIMSGDRPGNGAFPISHNLGWHGGLHLEAPVSENGFEPVRAISDGTIIFFRKPTEGLPNLPPTHPLMYNGATSDGVIIIKHETEIGEGENASITFYSLYMHLHEVSPTVQINKPVYRKDAIGRAGYIYGSHSHIHFEIICDDTNLEKITGRKSRELDTSSNGRTDVIFGEMYFQLPAGTEIFAKQPLLNHTQAMFSPPTPKGQPSLAPQEIPVAFTTTTDLYVGLNYAGGNSANGGKGDATLTTYQVDGSTIDSPIIEQDAEYTLYDLANKISKSYPAASRPAPSAVYELLRFGRIIGPDELIPSDVPHWRRINYPGGKGWVNLNAPNIKIFSDADFPHWRNWQLIDDSEDKDSRCDSTTIKNWLDLNNDGKIEPYEAIIKLSGDSIAKKLARTACKFPTEWDSETIDIRWGWLKTQTLENPLPMSDEDFERLRAHIAALAFWQNNLGIDTLHWHFQPREFIRYFRKCGWLSLRELTQLLPRKHGSNAKKLGIIPWKTAVSRFSSYKSDLNKVLRKYNILSIDRQTHFFAQTYIETALWSTMREFGQARQQKKKNGSLYWPVATMQFYNAFFGRGIMQLTWASNYEEYGNYRNFPNVNQDYNYIDNRISPVSTHYWSDPRDKSGKIVVDPKLWYPRYEPDDIASDSFKACDSGAYYWISKNVGGGLKNINQIADRGVVPEAIGRTSVLVNGGGFGFAERQAYAHYIIFFRGDSIEDSSSTSFTVTYRKKTHVIYVDFSPQRP